jgi:putative aldouronate transport system substrate-binding protein
MKGKSRHIQVLLTVMMVFMLVLTACGGNSNSPAASTAASKAPAEPAGTSATEQPKTDLKPYELTVAYMNIGNVKDLQAVQEAVNKITKAKMNATVKFMPIDPAAYQQQVNLMLAGNENLDLVVTFAGLGYNQQAAKGQLLPLDKLLNTHGQDVTKAVGTDTIKVSLSNGSVYGVPSIRDWAADYGVLMRKDLVDKYKIDLSKVKTYDDLEPIFKTIKENEPNMAGIVPEGAAGSIVSSIVYGLMDPLNDDNGVLPDHDNNLKVVNWFETKQYADLLTMVRKWYTAGYIPTDIATNKLAPEQLVKAGKAFSFVVHMKPGFEAKESLLTGTPMVAARILPPVATTTSITNVMFSIAKNSKDPERAMMFLNMLYSDKELINLIDFGIEGKHYVKKSDNVIGYPDGITSETATYSPNFGWMWGNQLLSYVWDNDDPDVYTKLGEFNKAAKRSKAMGFSFTVDPVKSEAAAVKNVKDQYKIGLEDGALDPVKNLPEFINKMKAAGMDKIVAEKQRQLDEWAKTNK